MAVSKSGSEGTTASASGTVLKEVVATSTTTPGGYLRTTVHFFPEEWEAIRRQAFQEKRTCSAVVRSAILVAWCGE